ncbi:glycogen debranching protein GlgX [Humidisolicoccus flavus]|uniref:glycogen debranching protein GlgX n=1 Tax=Humidisolicoccus flavus TaxID=3111414 RepID=UPI00324A6B3B
MHQVSAEESWLRMTESGPQLHLWSATATAVELRLFDRENPDVVVERIPMSERDGGTWIVTHDALQPGAVYGFGVEGPHGERHAFDPDRHALDPYARGLIKSPSGKWRSTIVDTAFDWDGVAKPNHSLGSSVIYELHVKGFTKLNKRIPKPLRGTYAGLAHESTIDYLLSLGITAIELLPVHQFVSEQWLHDADKINYWGYNTLSYFAPHAAYASQEARENGPDAVLREFKSMVQAMHRAGIEVILDVVYNHTAEEGRGGPASSFRLIDNSSYYRQQEDGSYIDVTGCGNTLDFSRASVQQLVLASLDYWANEVQIDGFRFDLAVALGRDEFATWDPEHPLLRQIVNSPALSGVKMIAEPWDVGLGGWQVGGFGEGWSEWNDGYRDRVRTFWLSDYGEQRAGGSGQVGIGGLAHSLAGSAGTFSRERGPLASVNFVTAHDGFTLTDLTRYNSKHNEDNGEDNRDGTDNNRSFNHGVEGRTEDRTIQLDRRKSMRNVLGTLLTSAGVPMMTAGDEFGRTQRGNNNPYCQDSELTWMPWQRLPWQDEFLEQTKRLIRLRRANPALRPLEYGVDGERVAGSTHMDWFNAQGEPMSIDDWNDSTERTLQYLAASTPVDEPFSRVLVVSHGNTAASSITLPKHDGITRFTLLWDSAGDYYEAVVREPGETVPIAAMSMRVYRCDGLPEDGIPEPTLHVERERSVPSAPSAPSDS